MHRIFLILFMLLTATANAADLYIRPFGNPAHPALIFLHGGPGYNSASFEASTAQHLADSGFFVIVYDRRGEGRSRDSAAAFTFSESSDDLVKIYERFGLKKASLIGHSFGGMVGLRFAEAHPEMIRSLVLLAAPVQMQESFRNIIARCRKIYVQRNDSTNLGYLRMLENMDTASMMYSTYCLGHAMQNGFYAPKERSAEAKAVYSAYREDTAVAKYAAQMDFRAPKGFWEHEHYTTLDLRKNIAALRRKGVRILGLYGKEDGLYAPEQVAELGRQLGEDKVLYLDNCSHNVFIDQQTVMIAAMQRWVR